jgi:hypothetical protein
VDEPPEIAERKRKKEQFI